MKTKVVGYKEIMAAKFEMISPREWKFVYQDKKYLLIEKDRGVYSIGKAIGLYSLEGTAKTYIKEICWTKSDNHDGFEKSNCLMETMNPSFPQIKQATLQYLDKLLN